MAIRVKPIRVHWNYFLALESDVAHLARFVEFGTANFKTYSIELSHLLMAASSEVDVVAKLICKRLQPKRKVRNIHDYASVLLKAKPNLKLMTVLVPRYGLTLKPWVSWTKARPPLWWSAYNKVKHQRDTHFQDANLGNCLNSVAGLFLLVLYYYGFEERYDLDFGDGKPNQSIGIGNKLATDSGRRNLVARLQPNAELFQLRTLLGDFSEKVQNEMS